MNLSLLLSQLFNGLQTGSIYALVALGYSMVYGIILLLNFAHGDIIMVGAYAAFYAMTSFHLHPIVSVVIAVVTSTLLGVVIEKVAYTPLRKAPRQKPSGSVRRLQIAERPPARRWSRGARCTARSPSARRRLNRRKRAAQRRKKRWKHLRPRRPGGVRSSLTLLLPRSRLAFSCFPLRFQAAPHGSGGSFPLPRCSCFLARRGSDSTRTTKSAQSALRRWNTPFRKPPPMPPRSKICISASCGSCSR